MSKHFETMLAQRFAPFNFSNVPGFPNTVPTMDEWGYFLPRFLEGEDENPAYQVLKFHQYMDHLNIHHEDVLTKMFMYSLDGSARKWYINIPPSSISFLKYFHHTFNSYYKRIYPDECIFEDCCRGYALYMQSLEADFSSSEDEADGYDVKKEEDLLSSSDSVSQEEICKNSDIKIDESIIEQKSSSLDIDQNAPLCGEDINISVEPSGKDIKVLDLDQHQLIQTEHIPIYDEYSDEKEQIPTSPFVDLRSSQRMYNNYESNFDKEQHCVKINYLESTGKY